MATMQPQTNFQKLQDAKIVTDYSGFTDADKAVFESLSSEEVDQLIALGNKLTHDFLKKHSGPTAGILF